MTEKREPFVSFAQNFEDVVLWRLFGERTTGTYVDVGAADPVLDSVTKVFYDVGWRGLNIEPAPHYATKLALARPEDVNLQVCAGAEQGLVMLHVVEDTGLSSISTEVIRAIDSQVLTSINLPVAVERLDSLMSQAGLRPDDIQFLKIDVEGAEDDVLRGIDFATWRPWVVIVEATRPNSTDPTHERWEHILIDSDYEFCLFDGLNRFYSVAEMPLLKKRLGSPACFFDQPFITAGHDVLHSEYLGLLASSQRLNAVYETAVCDYKRVEALYQAALKVGEVTRTELDRLSAAHEELSGQHRALIEEVGLTRQALARVTAQLGDAESATARANLLTRAAEAELTTMQLTLSWRATGWLRRIRGPRAVQAGDVDPRR
jgi:FkbM family methyltransferase